jgi:peptide/nickel transport system substrate-binding protein
VKKLFFVLLVVVIAASTILVSCGKETTSTPTTTVPPQTTPAITTPASPTPVTTVQTKTTSVQTTPSQKVPTGTLRAVVPSWIETMDPNLQTTFEYALYEHLIGIDEEGNFVPELAESWSLSADGMVYTFKLRKGMKFHNGDELTSADVKFSLERLMRPGSMSPWVGQYTATIDHIDTPDPYTVKVYDKKVDYMFYTALWGCPIVPKDYIEENGDAYFNEHPIGTAPWKFVKLIPGVRIEFEAVPNHWRITPDFAKLAVSLVPETSTALAGLRQGETDIVAVNMDEALEMQSEGFELQVLGRPISPVMCMLGTWATDGPISDVRVREALSLAINRSEIANSFFNGLAEPGGVLWTAPSSWGYDPSWVKERYFAYDPDAAKALLAEAGYPDKFANPEITLYSHMSTAWLPDLNLIISGYWEAIGVQTKVVPIDMGQLRGMMYTDPYPEELKGTVAIWPMPTMQVSIPFLMSAIHSKGNWRLLQDANWDALHASISQSPDPDEQIRLFRETVEYMLGQYIAPGIVNIYSYYAVSHVIGDWQYRFQYDLWGNFCGIKHK